MRGGELAISTILLSSLSTAGWAEPERLQPIGSYAVQGQFFEDGGDLAVNLSGMACTGLPALACLAVNDENQGAQFVAVEDERLVVGQPIALIDEAAQADPLGNAPVVTTCPGGSKPFKELDGEAVAFASPYFYVVGSHGCGRNNEAFRLSTFLLARIDVEGLEQLLDPQAAPLSDAAIAESVETTYRLSDMLLRADELAPFFGASLNGANGLNIEGAAVIGDRLFAGLRAPSLDDHSFIAVSLVSDLFAPGHEPAKTDPEILPVALGPGTGIRDLAALPDGRLLILAGPAQEQDVPYGLFVVEPRSGGRLWSLGSLAPVTEGGTTAKAESVTLLAAEEDRLRVLILFDGIENGGPRDYWVPID